MIHIMNVLTKVIIIVVCMVVLAIILSLYPMGGETISTPTASTSSSTTETIVASKSSSALEITTTSVSGTANKSVLGMLSYILGYVVYNLAENDFDGIIYAVDTRKAINEGFITSSPSSSVEEKLVLDTRVAVIGILGEVRE